MIHSRLQASLRDLIRERLEAGAEARQRGFITMQVLAITVLLLVAGAGLVGVAQATIHTSREARDFTDARRGADSVEAAVIEQMQTPGNAPIVLNGDGWLYPKSGSGTTGRTSWKWTTLGTANPYFADNRRVVSIETKVDGIGSDAADTVETLTLPVRGTYVASRDVVSSSNGGITYGIPAGPRAPGATTTNPVSGFAMGLWANAVSTSAGTSTIVGDVGMDWFPTKTNWATFGGSISNAGNARVVSYTDAVTSAPGSTSFSRSRLNAYMDTRISDQLMSNVRSNEDCSGYRNLYFFTAIHGGTGGENSYGCWKGNLTYQAVNGTPGGPITHVVKGNLTLAGNISTGSSGELHIYVDGDVTFGDGSTATRSYNRVYIYAPNGTCRAAPGTTVALNGAIACKTVILDQGTSNSIRWNAPREQGNARPYTLSTNEPGNDYRAVDAPKVIHYFERPDYVDMYTQ